MLARKHFTDTSSYLTPMSSGADPSHLSPVSASHLAQRRLSRAQSDLHALFAVRLPARNESATSTLRNSATMHKADPKPVRSIVTGDTWTIDV